MTRSDWDKVLSGDWLGREIKYDDKIKVTYRCNWHRGRGSMAKDNKTYFGLVESVGTDGIRFQMHKRLSYKSIREIAFHFMGLTQGA